MDVHFVSSGRRMYEELVWYHWMPVASSTNVESGKAFPPPFFNACASKCNLLPKWPFRARAIRDCRAIAKTGSGLWQRV